MEALGEAVPKPEFVPVGVLNERVRNGTLLTLVLDAARTLEWPESELKLAASSGYAFRRLALLTAVTYCHAAGVYDAKAIALRIAREDVLRFLCAGTFPTQEDIQAFVGANQRLIQEAFDRACQLARELDL